MAGKTGPEDGAEAVPVEPALRSEGDKRPEAEDARSDDGLSPGEPSWPEDRDALRVEALSEEGVGPDSAGPTAPDPVSSPSPDGPTTTDAGTDLATPGKAGPSWDWNGSSTEVPAGATVPERLGTEQETGGTTSDLHDRDARATLPADPDPVRPASEPWPAGMSGVGSTPAASTPPPRRGGVGALLLGGMIAAALGFGAAWVARDQLGPDAVSLPADLEERLADLETRPAPDGTELQVLSDRLDDVETRLQTLGEASPQAADPAASVDLEPLREEIAAGLDQAQSRVAELEERLAALEARPAAPAGEDPGPAVRATASPEAAPAAEEASVDLEPRLAQVESALSTATESLSAVETALASLEERVGANDEALAAFDQRLTEALAAFDQRLTEAEAAGATAIETARTATASLEEAESRAAEAETRARTGAALATLDAAVAQGQPFETALSDLQAAGTAVPETLAQAAAQGVPTLASLREEFPEAARAGLAAAREAELVDGNGVMGFLRSQLSVRSTAPREGEDPDAVLSRAEAALADGQLEVALREIETLPEPVRAAMAGWIARAEARAQVQASLATLRQVEPEAAPAD